ncbi:FixH family protein [Palleronia pelagia]|uniref:Nitrogen fixation protein FixH n=1 Tax=Palleronia pelagia TaxID=387096 RepID=A0A1H8KMC8_9RHOB|nr:FixH family protein [Palleronia pelagia]SEN94140.1 Nitrogen fixation protein FixH [Palleronia pelagia]
MTELKGRHVAAMFVGGFGIIISVNLALAVNAVRSFPGLEVANSYVASQSFEDRRDAQDALGWEAQAAYRKGMLHLSILDAAGAPAPVRDLSVHVGRPTEQRDDTALELDATGTARAVLAPGIWRLDISASAPDGTPYRHALRIRVNP